MSEYTLVIPSHFDEDASLIATKGWLQGVAILVADRRYEPVFYDPVRFAQTVTDDVRDQGVAVPENVVIVPEVTRVHIEGAVSRLAADDFALLRALPPTGR